MRRVLFPLLAAVLLGGAGVAIAARNMAGPDPVPRSAARTLSPRSPSPPHSNPAPGPEHHSAPKRHTGPLVLAGCPPPERPPGPPGPPPWRPAVLVPDSELPSPRNPRPWDSNPRPAAGKGMWIWQFDQTEGGNAEAVVRKAKRAGLRHLWVRVGSSREGFYGAPILDQLVGPAHAAGLDVIGWGFPYLYDPLRDAAWTARALAWRGPNGEQLDGFSPDIEKSTEGVALSKRRAAVYLGAVRRAAGDRPIIATVYRPTDLNWNGVYPYRTIARYVDAFAPMVYWGCVDPREAAQESIDRLAALRPVHLIGQAYNMGPEGGRTKAPSPREIAAFMDVGLRNEALGASFWSWQHISGGEWRTMAAFPWPLPVGVPPADRAA